MTLRIPQARSATRMAASGVVHAVVLLLLLSLRSTPRAPVAIPVVTRVVLNAPRMRLPSRRPKRFPDSVVPMRSSSASKSVVKVFAMPTAAPAHFESSRVMLPEVTIQPPLTSTVPVATPVSASLPAAPVVVGKLSSAATAPEESSVGGRVHNAGFGAKIQAEPTSQRTLVTRAGFGDASASMDSRPETRLNRSPRTTAVEILNKPRPVYTEEARKLRIEGEVLLEVLFPASGEVRVLRVIEGLGYGLDRTAAESASRIGYRPATRDGQAVDQTATVHIVFQLAY
jgi:TonB family protein